mgnify:CR=1 FL=1
MDTLINWEELSEIEKMQFQVLQQRVSLTPLRKLWISWMTARKLRKKSASLLCHTKI